MTTGEFSAQEAPTNPNKSCTTPPPAPRWWSQWTPQNVINLVVAITALVAGLAGLLKPESSARKVFAAGVQADVKLSDDAKANHQEIAEIRTYLDKEHSDPVPVPVVLPSAVITASVKDAGVAIVPLRPFVRAPPAPAKRAPVGYTPPSYEAVTGTKDTGLTL